MSRIKESGQVGIAVGIIAAVVVIGIIIMMLFVRRVPPGNVGVLVDYGKGTLTGQPEISPVQPGRFKWVGPLQDMPYYPTAQQSLIMVRGNNEAGSERDESVDCKDETGIKVNVDVTVIWKVKSDLIGPLYLNYPNRDINQIRDELVRRLSRQAVADACGQYGFIEIAGVQRVLFGDDVAKLLGPAFTTNYLEMVDVSVGEVYLEPEQQQAITAKSVAEQKALQAKFLEEQRKAEAAAAIAQAEGEKQAAIIRAQGMAEAARIITQELGGREYYIRYLWIEKWNGAVPFTLVTSDGQEYELIVELPEGIDQPVPTSEYPMPTPTASAEPTQ